MNWSSAKFESLYNGIESAELDRKLFDEILPDLQDLNLNHDKCKNSSSRSQLEKGEVTFSDGSTYKINQEFMIAAIAVSDELNLDEIVVCEMMINDTGARSSETGEELSLINRAKVNYFMRRQFILQLTAFLINCVEEDNPIYVDLLANGKLVVNVLKAFRFIHSQLADIKQLISKARILDNYHALEKRNVKFKRDFLLKEYDILGQILCGLMVKGDFLSREHLMNLINHVCEMHSNDFFIVYYLPAIFCAFGNLDKLPDKDVRSIHDQFIKDLRSEEIYTNPIKVSLIFVFLSYFIGWCKSDPSERANTMDFTVAVDEPMTRAVEYGAMELLLIFAAETSMVEKDASFGLYYDVRSLLERHLPRLIPIQLLDSDTTIQQQQSQLHNNPSDSTYTAPNSHDTKDRAFECISLSEGTESFFLTMFHDVLRSIIADCAFLLTKIKDAEEDSLLSGEDLNLDEIALRADLERFFLTIYYFYSFRPEYGKLFWEDKESNAYGFIEWSAKCHDSLMKSCFYLMISSLSCGLENSLSVYHYFVANNDVTWDLMAQCIKNYIVKICNLTARVQQRQLKRDSEEVDSSLVALEDGLNEEAVIFISSLFTLIGSVANNIEEDIKTKLSKLYTEPLFEFAKLETPLIGACFKTLSHLVPFSEIERSSFWYSLDSFIFKTGQPTMVSDSYRSIFMSKFTNFSEVVGFLSLFQKLLVTGPKKEYESYMAFGKLAFPSNLGRGYRKVGINPYFDYILQEVLVNSGQLHDSLKTRCIQSQILHIMEEALLSFDYNVILNSIAASANLDKLVSVGNFATYIQECPATIVFNYIFTEKVYKSIFDIVSIGIDDIHIELDGGNEQLKLINLSLKVLNIILDFQGPYIEEFVPVINKQENTSYYIPKDFGLHGLRSFYDAIFFHLSVVAHLGLYVGLNNFDVALNSVRLLGKLAARNPGESSPFAAKNTLLTIFDSVDESARIKDAFISQIERTIDCEEALTLKIEILDFIRMNLPATEADVTISHLLLGFQVSNVISTGPNLSTFINSDNSLLNSVVNLMEASLHNVDRSCINYAPMRLAALSLSIIMVLCRNSLTSRLALDYFVEHRLFELLVSLDPQADVNTLWNGRMFNLRQEEEFKQSESLGALLSFLSFRTELLQYLSLSIHRLASSGRGSQIRAHTDLLISNTLYSARVFSLISSLNYGDMLHQTVHLDGLKFFKDLPIKLDLVTTTKSCLGHIYDLSAVDSLAGLSWRVKSNHYTDCLSSSPEAMEELDVIHTKITSVLARQSFVKGQLSILHSWAQLVEIIASDGELSCMDRSNFILEVFGAIIPKINDYIEFDVSFSEELVSLAVTLFEVYQKDRMSVDGFQTIDNRLYNLFKTCIHGINSPLSSFSIRSNFYLLANSYLVHALGDTKLARQILQDLKMGSEVLVEVISKDAIYGQGTNRITSIFLLDSLVRLGDINKENFILDFLMKKTQLLLIIRSLKNINVFLTSPQNNVSIDDLLYELTAFKSVTYLLIRIAENRNGAHALIQNKLFQVIEDCSALQLDPDLGLDLVINELSAQNSGLLSINVSLDNPLFMGRDAYEISLFELIVPIFQLIAAVLLSMGSANLRVMSDVKSLLVKFRKLSIGIMKRDALKDMNEKYRLSGVASEGQEQMVRLIVLLCTLTGYRGEETI
ncbi:hypothetical protein HG536_0E03750 [Torulaspora globosa]|uniref:Nucleoporin n=1 Tax=Torulaspora globosa TaxID=48254 RepID=A0A7G3ZIX8_9SACH|nr:uncharacterized protein HG536_0E03750 [Torulaspora globosa]QLL33464.1 hypothetical protein HG536_0E03750 [Torulaspora globosa]